MIQLRRELLLWVLGTLWLGGIVVGFFAWERYDATSEIRSHSETNTDRPASGRWSIVMFAHPRCPCTRASLTEFRELLTQAPAGVDAQVLFVRPKGTSDGWERGDL